MAHVGERLIENREYAVRLRRREHQRRRQADGVPAGAEDQHAARERALDDGVALLHRPRLRHPILHELDPDHQAAAADVADDRVLLLQFPHAGHQVLADDGRVGSQLRLQQANRRDRRSTGDRVAAEGARVRARRPGHHVRPGAGHAERQARRNALGDGDDIRLEADVIRREHPAGPAHP